MFSKGLEPYKYFVLFASVLQLRKNMFSTHSPPIPPSYPLDLFISWVEAWKAIPLSMISKVQFTAICPGLLQFRKGFSWANNLGGL